MSSSVFFKFKSQKEPSRVTFDGTGISVFELKREIISINRLGDGTDFDLAIYNEDTNEEYDDDTTIIPRSTSIIARRLPAAKAGRGSAARYVSGKMPVHARNAGRVEAQATKPTSQAPAASSAAAEMDNAQTEEERIAAMFKAGADQWEQQQQEMANATPVYRGGPFKGKPMNVPDHKPPQGYICYRCGEKGHWIQACPTNNDPNFDGRPRVKRTTGIPRSFLKTIEKPAALGGDGLTEDARQVSGVMVNAEGEFVIAEPDKASWEQYQAKAKVSAAAQEAAATGSKEVRERGLECPIDKRMFVEPTKSPCCGRTYCAECISNALIESDFVCPGCSSEGVLIDNLEPDAEAAQKIKEFEEEKAAAKKEKEKETEASKSPPAKQAATPTATGESKVKSPSPAAAKTTTNGLPNAAASNATDGATSKKRAAEEELENDRVPNGPEAMRRLSSSHTPRPPTQTPKSPQNLDPASAAAFQQMNHIMPQNLPFGNNQDQQFPNNGVGGFFPQQHGMNGVNPMGFPTSGGNNFMGMPPNMPPMMNMNMNMNGMMDPSGMMPGMGMGFMNNMNNNNPNGWGNMNMNGMGGSYGGGVYGHPNGGSGGGPHFPNNMMGAPNGYNQPMNMNMPNGMGGLGPGPMNPMGGMNPMGMPHMNGMPNGGGAAPQMMHTGGAGAGGGLGKQFGAPPSAGPMGSGFPNQQRTIFSEPFPNEEDDAYFRKPVNPHRHQSRQRRIRPSDYREL